MTFYKTTAMFGATACLLMASAAYGVNVTNTFNEATGNWAGGSLESATYTAPTPAGLPTGGTSLAPGNQVLAIAGSATNVYSAAGDHYVDMMVKVSIPDEGLNGLPDEATGAKFAVAVDTNGLFRCYAGATSPAWTNLSSTVYAADDWVRVTMKFDYTGKTCTVALNGDPCGTYGLLDPEASALASIEVRGSTAIDEVVVAQGTTPAFYGNDAIATGATATKKWLTANDITWPENPTSAEIDKLDAQYKFGLDPHGTLTTLPLEFVQDGESTKATLAFPGFGAYGGTGTYVLQSKSGSASWGDVGGATINSANGANTTQITLPSEAGTAVYYRILAKQPGS